ncbi:MAG: hypothetical protein WKG07_05740 [Hymenobacter sp.]
MTLFYDRYSAALLRRHLPHCEGRGRGRGRAAGGAGQNLALPLPAYDACQGPALHVGA